MKHFVLVKIEKTTDMGMLKDVKHEIDTTMEHLYRVAALSGIVYKGFINDIDYEVLMELKDWADRCGKGKEIKVFDIGNERSIEEIFERQRILRDKRWMGTHWYPTMGPV